MSETSWTKGEDEEARPLFSVNDDKVHEENPAAKKKRVLLLGSLAVLGLTADWSTQAEYGSWIAGKADLGGYVISYWAFSQFIVMFPLLMLIELIVRRTILRHRVLQWDHQDEEDIVYYKDGSRAGLRPLSRLWFRSYFYESLDSLCVLSNFTHRRCIGVSMALGFIFYLSAWTWFLSLGMMPAADNTAAYQSTTVFVFIFSILILKERLRLLKTISVIVCVVGVVLLAVGSSDGNSTFPHVWLGYLLCFFSAALYALYEVLFAKYFGSQNLRSTFLFLFFTGIFVLFVLWPGFFIVYYSGLDTRVPVFSSPEVTGYLIGNGFLQIGFVSFFLLGISLTGSPLFITIGSMLTIPVTAMWDRYVNEVPPASATTIAGLGVIGVGFVLMLLDIALSPATGGH